MRTLYDQWIAGEIGNFGNFQTTTFKAYQYADLDNRKRLKTAFPYWFALDANAKYTGEDATETPVVQFNEDFITRVWFHPHQWEDDKILQRLKVSGLPYTVKEEDRGFTVEVTLSLNKVGYLLGLLTT